MEAMASARPHSSVPRHNSAPQPPRRSVGQLWQLPLLLVSLGLFGYAAYLFIDPKPGLTIDQKIDVGRKFLAQERPDAAIEHLNKLLNTEKLDKPHEGDIHLLLAQAISVAENQKDRKLRIPRKHEQIIEQTQLALAGDVKPTYEIERRLAESYEALKNMAAALKHYREAAAMDPDHSLRMQRKIIDLQLDQDELDGAAASLEEYIARHDISDAERSWALCESAHLKIDHGNFAEARQLLAEASKLVADPVDQGQINYWMGYCAWKLGDPDEAERFLRVARDQMHARHPLDGDAAFVLGRIFQEKREWKIAASFYEVVLVDHPDARVAAQAKLGRGLCRIAVAEDDPGLTDLHDLVNRINQRGESAAKTKLTDEAVETLKQASEMLTVRGNYQGALDLLAYEQDLRPQVPPTFFARLGGVFEKRAAQVEKLASAAKPADQLKLQQQSRDLRAKAGDAYIAYSKALTVFDDKGYADALWHGIDLYEKAGDLRRTSSALKLFITERPVDPLAPDALLRLGRAYQAMGAYDDAIAAFQQNLFKHANTLAASKSAVPLAAAYIAKGPDFYPKAEHTLQELLDSPLITPEAIEFRQSLFELAQLYYRTNRFEEAIAKLEEVTQRYPQDERMGRSLFLMADSYRKSAQMLAATVALPATQPTDPAVDPLEAIAAKKSRLTKARVLYDRVIETYRAAEPTDEVERLYQKLSHYYRADCCYDLASYNEAIRLYDVAAFRYQDDPSALSAYVQIVNCYCALGKFDEARTANERAKVLLKRIPSEAFSDGSFTMPKEYWQEWLKWTGDSGIWSSSSSAQTAKAN
jgi:tetratricopeptide (TPR) repeat protein